MAIDTAAILAARYKDNPAPLKAAVLGQGEVNINPYAALRALQLQREAEKFEAARAAMMGQQYQNQPSMVEQAMSPQAQPPMPQQMPQQMQPPPQQPQEAQGLAGMPMPEQGFAPGGIVAFAGADGSLVDEEDTMSNLIAQLQEGQQDSAGDPATFAKMSALFPQLMKNIAGQKYTPTTPQEFKQDFEARRELLQQGTTSPFAEFKGKLDKFEQDRVENLRKASGLALLQAIPEVLQPGGLGRGLGRAAGKFSETYGRAVEADRGEQRALASLQFNLADAERKDAMGLNREAIAAADQARQDRNAAQRFSIEKNRALASLAISGARATKPSGTGAGGPKNFDALAQVYYEAGKAENDKLPENQRKSDTAIKRQAYKEAAADWAKIPAGEAVALKERQVSTEEGKAAEQQRANKEKERREAAEQIQKSLGEFDKNAANRRLRAQDPAAYEEKRNAHIKELEERFPAGKGSAPAAPAGNKKSQAAPAGGKVITKAQLEAVAEKYGKTYAEAAKAAKEKGYTIKE